MDIPLDKDRRRVLRQGLTFAAVALVGCGGAETDPFPGAGSSVQPPSTPGTMSRATVWVAVVPTLVVGSGEKFDLTQTLPAGIAPGGNFGVDPGGVPLPSGMVLSANGTLSVGSATVGTVTGVRFTYDEP